MESVILVIHIFAALALVAVILVQRSEGGALSGLGGGSPAMGFMTVRGTSNMLTRTTAVLAVIFMASGLFLVSTSSKGRQVQSIIHKIEQPKKSTQPTVPIPE